MRIPQIESHLRQRLPVIYPSFTDEWLSITSANVASDVMTITATNTLSVNDQVIITGLIYENSINTVTLNLEDNRAVVFLADVHEFTEVFSETLIISGANESEWNDTFNILSVISRFEVEIQISPAITGEPTGSPVVEEIELPRYNSLFPVVTASGLSFTVDVINAPDGSLSGTGEFIKLNDIKVSSDVDFQRIQDAAYTKQERDVVWIFVIAGATGSSRSRDTKTDFDQSFQVGEERIIHTQDNFSVFAFYPTFKDVSAVEAQDTARNELRKALISLLVGFVPDSSLCSKSNMIYYIADGVETYNASYYVHRYDFAVNVNITQDDTFIEDSYAVRKIETSYIDEDNLLEIANDKIDFTEVT